MEASWVLIFSAFPVLQEASFPTFLLKTFHFQKLVLESESRYIVGCFICSIFDCISVFLSHLKGRTCSMFHEGLFRTFMYLHSNFSPKKPRFFHFFGFKKLKIFFLKKRYYTTFQCRRYSVFKKNFDPKKVKKTGLKSCS